MKKRCLGRVNKIPSEEFSPLRECVQKIQPVLYFVMRNSWIKF